MKIPRPRLLPILCGIAASYSPQAALAQSQMSANDLYRMASPSVLLIETYGEDEKVSGNGTGFLVGEKGEILTNYHVIAHTKRATVRLANDDAYDTVEVLDIDKRKDIALLKIKVVGIPHLKLGRSATVQVGDKLYALGNPLGVFQNSLSDGILSGIRQMDGYKLFQLSTPISHGSSGSPVLNSSGEVVGIIESTVDAGQNLNFAIPIDYAVGLLDSRTPRSLISTYEPEEKPETKSNEKVDAKPSQPTSFTGPSQGIKQDAFTYASNKLGIWTKEDSVRTIVPSRNLGVTTRRCAVSASLGYQRHGWRPGG